jgi:hypothetical protein
MEQDFFDPSLGQHDIVLICGTTIRQVEPLIESCEHCNPEFSWVPFECVLDGVTGYDPTFTDYLLEEPAKCPRCRHDILENTLVETD